MADLPKLTRRQWDALGSLLLPPKLGGKINLGPKMGASLQSHGLVERFEEMRAFNDGLPPMRIRGWRLTMAGNIAYCLWVGEQDAEDGA